MRGHPAGQVLRRLLVGDYEREISHDLDRLGSGSRYTFASLVVRARESLMCVGGSERCGEEPGAQCPPCVVGEGGGGNFSRCTHPMSGPDVAGTALALIGAHLMRCRLD